MHILSAHADPEACLCSVISGSPCYLQGAWSAPCLRLICIVCLSLIWCRVPMHRAAKLFFCVCVRERDGGKKDSNKWIMGADEGGKRQVDCLLVSERWKRPTLNGGQSEWSGRSGFTLGWPLEEDVFLCSMFLGNLWGFFCERREKKKHFFPIECLHRYLQSPQEELHYSQLTAVKYPCSWSSQIPLRQRQSITHTHTHTHLCPTPASINIFCVMLNFHKSAPSKPQASQTVSTPRCVWRPQSVYRCISTCMTCFCLKSSFSSIWCQLPLSALSANPLC